GGGGNPEQRVLRPRRRRPPCPVRVLQATRDPRRSADPPEGSRAMKVAAIQHDIDWEDGAATRKRVTPLIAQAAAAGARLIALTEMYATGFSMRPDRIAEDEGGPNERFMVDKAREHGCWLVGSIAQRSHDGQPRNVAVLAAPARTVHRSTNLHPL